MGRTCKRVAEDAKRTVNRLADLRRIGIDEISYKRNHHYPTVVVDHDTKLLVWAAPGRDKQTLAAFFDLLGPQGCQRITHVSADGADWIKKVVKQRCPDALAEPTRPCRAVGHRGTRRGTPRGVKRRPRCKGKATAESKALKNARWALWKNPEDLSEAQQAKLDWIERTLHRSGTGHAC